MEHLNKENINKNQVETVEQFKVLSYLKSTFNFDEIELYLYDKTTIKLIDKKKAQEKEEIINLIYILRYYNNIFITEKTQIKDEESLKYSKNELERRD